MDDLRDALAQVAAMLSAVEPVEAVGRR